MTLPSDVEIDDDLANRLSALLAELLESERQSIAGADDVRREELRGLIEWRELLLGDDDELVQEFDEYIATRPQRPNRIRELQMFSDWRSNLHSELAEWQNELGELENRSVDKQAIFSSASNKVAYLLRRAAENAELLPDRFGIDNWHDTPATSTPSQPNSYKQAQIGQRGTVKESAIYWLGYVVTDRNGQTVGLTYDEVLERVLKDHPSANTSKHGIGFYASHIRRRSKSYKHGTLPDIRPRSR